MGRYLHKIHIGFTLLEMSIVLVIIGFLAGGITLGKDLIEGAKVRQAAVQIEKINEAISIFNQVYHALPGDYKDAVATLGAAKAGDGNGIINKFKNASQVGDIADVSATPGSYNELPLVWNHLWLAGLVDTPYDGSNTSFTPGVNFPVPVNSKSRAMLLYTLSFNIPLASNYVFNEDLILMGSFVSSVNDAIPWSSDSAAYSASFLSGLDKKLDDGYPRRGLFRATSQGFYNPASNSCTVSDGTSYLQEVYNHGAYTDLPSCQFVYLVKVTK